MAGTKDKLTSKAMQAEASQSTETRRLMAYATAARELVERDGAKSASPTPRQR